jgi:hypothetical protein
VGAVLLARRRTPEVVVLVAVAAANTVFYARVPFWPGDNSWGPRYTLIVLPVVVPLAIGVLRWTWGLRAIQVAGVVGLLLVGVPGTLVNFNVVYIEANRELGAGTEAEALRNQWAWQPIRRHLQMLPDAVMDSVGSDEPGEVQRPEYTHNSDDDYAFYGVEPRLDVWWAWIGPTGASGLTWAWFAPAVLSLALATGLWVGGRDRRGSEPNSGRC